MSSDLIKALKKRIEFDGQRARSEFFENACLDANCDAHSYEQGANWQSEQLQPVLLAMVSVVACAEQSLKFDTQDSDNCLEKSLTRLKEAVSGNVMKQVAYEALAEHLPEFKVAGNPNNSECAVDRAIDREDVARSREEPHPGDEQLDLFEWGRRNE